MGPGVGLRYPRNVRNGALYASLEHKCTQKQLVFFLRKVLCFVPSLVVVPCIMMFTFFVYVCMYV